MLFAKVFGRMCKCIERRRKQFLSHTIIFWIYIFRTAEFKPNVFASKFQGTLLSHGSYYFIQTAKVLEFFLFCFLLKECKFILGADMQGPLSISIEARTFPAETWSGRLGCQSRRKPGVFQVLCWLSVSRGSLSGLLYADQRLFEKLEFQEVFVHKAENDNEKRNFSEKNAHSESIWKTYKAIRSHIDIVHTT